MYLRMRKQNKTNEKKNAQKRVCLPWASDSYSGPFNRNRRLLSFIALKLTAAYLRLSVNYEHQLQ